LRLGVQAVEIRLLLGIHHGFRVRLAPSHGSLGQKCRCADGRVCRLIWHDNRREPMAVFAA
ncbi:hypothetical protein, partial [Burkholderia pseudomallei]|uniref:hypothetical protein n=1 Tax=Burkholderia pseudomallei TaxID=28450 RepID=UPI001C4CF6D5